MTNRRRTPASPAVAEQPPLLDDARIGFEARAGADDHQAVKIWLRLLSCSTQIEHQIRDRLRQRFATTLPRFDYLAQLQRHPEGLRMNALSRYLMVTGGNVTGLTDQLVTEGHVERLPDPVDRRSLTVRLTPAGHAHFARMAQEHEDWLRAMFDGCDAGFKDTLYTLLGQLRQHLSRLETDASAANRPLKPAATAPKATAKPTTAAPPKDR